MKTGGYGPVSTNQLIVSFIPVFPMLYLQPDYVSLPELFSLLL